MKVLCLGFEEKFWDWMIGITILLGRARRTIETKWFLRKGKNTTWNDVWHYLDWTRHNWDTKHRDRLTYFSQKRDKAFVRKMDAKYQVKL